MYAAAKQKQLLDFPLYLLVLSRLQTDAETAHCLLSDLYLHKKSEAHVLPQSSCLIFLEWCSYDKPTTSMTPCIHCQILSSADFLTWLSDPCLFKMQKLLLYHQLKWLPKLFLTLPVLHQNLQMALFNFFQHDRRIALLMVCRAVRPPAPNPDPCTSPGTESSGTALPKGSLPRPRRQAPAPSPRAITLTNNDLNSNSFPRALKSTPLCTAFWERLVHRTNKHQPAQESVWDGWHIFCAACKAAGISLCCWCRLFPSSQHVFFSHLLLKLKRKTVHT